MECFAVVTGVTKCARVCGGVCLCVCTWELQRPGQLFAAITRIGDFHTRSLHSSCILGTVLIALLSRITIQQVTFAASIPNVWGIIDKLVTQDLLLCAYTALCNSVREVH